MSLVVLDASVAAKWFLPSNGETLTDEALHLLRRYVRGEVRFVVPDLFWAETGNILWKAMRQGRCTKSTAEEALGVLKQRKVPTVSSVVLIEQAFAIATSFDRTVYDSLYVALAVESRCNFVTADQRLANALAPHWPVKWLGSFV